MGQLTIEIFPTFKNLVWCKVKGFNAWDDAFGDFNDMVVGNTIDVGQANNGQAFNCVFPSIYQSGYVFTQINSFCNNHYHYENQNNNVWEISAQSFKANTSTLVKFHLYLAFYMLKMDVYNAL